MKNKILFALLVLVVAFSLVGCGPSADQFVGKWKEDSGYSYYDFYYELTKDGKWTYVDPYFGGRLLNSGTWTWNGDNTATLVDDYGNEFKAAQSSDYKNENDESSTRYLLIDDVKYWEVEEEVEDEE